MTNESSVWTKARLAAKATPPSTPESTASGEAGEQSIKKTLGEAVKEIRRRALVADAISVVLWSYVIVKLFIFDVDRYVAGHLGGAATRFLDYRALIFLAFLAVAILLLRRKRILWIPYVLFFPVILILFHLPYFLHRTGSWLPVVGLANLIYGAKQNFRRGFALRVVELSAIVFTFTMPGTALMYGFAGVIVLAMAHTYWRTLRHSLKPLGFLEAQVSWASRVLKSPIVVGWASIPADLKNTRARRFNEKQLEKFTQSLSNALLAVKVANLYAYQLERYRRSSIPFMLSFASFGTLYVYTIFVVAVTNLALFKADVRQFSFDRDPTFLMFLNYSLNALFVNGINELAPVGSIALSLKVASGVLGPLLLMTLALAAVLSYRQTREGEALQESLAAIKDSAQSLNLFLADEYEVSPKEALRRLNDLGVAAAGFITYIASRIPSHFDDYFDDQR